MAEQHPRILVCDDEPDVRRMLVAALRDQPITVDEAVDGRRAIELLREHRYAVILLDLMMPQVDGFAVLEAIDFDTAPPVVLVVTGAGRHVLERIGTKKVHGVIRKPFDPIEIAAVVRACAEIRSRGSFETMAYATILSGAPLIALLVK